LRIAHGTFLIALPFCHRHNPCAFFKPTPIAMKDPQTNALLQMLMKCIAACEHCADACLDEKDPRHMANCIRLDRDCADICTLTARYLARNSARLHSAMELCISICDECHTECALHDAVHCRKCAEVCRQCRDLCREYAAVHA
jgi:hypothetical protein